MEIRVCQWGCDPQVENHLPKRFIGLLFKSGATRVTEDMEENTEAVLERSVWVVLGGGRLHQASEPAEHGVKFLDSSRPAEMQTCSAAYSK